jgi:hypothetical protein
MVFLYSVNRVFYPGARVLVSYPLSYFCNLEANLTFSRWGSKLINDGDISFYQFMVSFMGIFFSGQAAGQLFGFSSSMLLLTVDVITY